MRQIDKFQFIELNGHLMWCDFGANLVQHFIKRYSRYSRYSRYQTVLSKLQEIIIIIYKHPKSLRFRVFFSLFTTILPQVWVYFAARRAEDTVFAILTLTSAYMWAYSAFVTEEEYNKKSYYKKQDNYHGIGKENLIEILEKSEKPIAAFADVPDAKELPLLFFVLESSKKQGRIFVK